MASTTTESFCYARQFPVSLTPAPPRTGRRREWGRDGNLTSSSVMTHHVSPTAEIELEMASNI